MLKILVIDDDDIFLEFMEQLLIKSGHYVRTAEYGEEGLTKFNETYFDLVITDFFMPYMNGSDVARYIRNSERSDTPIICITGEYNGRENMKMFNKIIMKPVKIKDILNAVNQLGSRNERLIDIST